MCVVKILGEGPGYGRGVELLVERVERWAGTRADTRAFTYVAYAGDEDGTRHTLTWHEVDRRARGIANRLREVARPGDRAAVLAPQGLGYVTAMLGAFYSGVTAVPLFPPDLPRHGDRLAHILRDVDAACALTTANAHDAAERYLRDQGLSAAGHVLAADAVPPGDDDRTPVTADDVAYLQYTSGSTRAPAGVVITHGALTANAGQIDRAVTPTPGRTVAVSWLPLFHDMGLVLALAMPAYGPYRGVFMDPVAFLMRPARWLRLISSERNAEVFTAAPNFAYDLCVDRIGPRERAGLDLSGARLFLNGAEPVRRDTVARFTEAFIPSGLPERAVCPAYGLAEATVYVSADSPDRPPRATAFDRDRLAAGTATPADGDARTYLMSCGRPIGQDVLIVNPVTGRIRAPGGVGEIWVHGPNVARAYWGPDGERDGGVFGASVDAPGVPGGPWLRTGDLGVLYDGELYVTGRVKDLIIVDGRNHYPQDIEATVQTAHPALRRDRAVAFSAPGPEGECLVVVAERDRRAADASLDDVTRAVRRAVAKGHELRLHDFVLAEPGSVPRTSSGKIARAACRRLYLDRTLEVAHA